MFFAVHSERDEYQYVLYIIDWFIHLFMDFTDVMAKIVPALYHLS